MNVEHVAYNLNCHVATKGPLKITSSH